MTQQEYERHFRRGFRDAKDLARDVAGGRVSRGVADSVLRDAQRNIEACGATDMPYSTGVFDGWQVGTVAYGVED